MEEAGRVLLVPIFRRHWLWYAWGERTAAAAIAGAGRAAAAAAAKPPRNWRQGQNLEEKMQLLGQQARAWVSWRVGVGCCGPRTSGQGLQVQARMAIAAAAAPPNPSPHPKQPPKQIQGRLWTEWRKLETAAEGTLRNRGYKCAAAVHPSGACSAHRLWRCCIASSHRPSPTALTPTHCRPRRPASCLSQDGAGGAGEGGPSGDVPEEPACQGRAAGSHLPGAWAGAALGLRWGHRHM